MHGRDRPTKDRRPPRPHREDLSVAALAYLRGRAGCCPEAYETEWDAAFERELNALRKFARQHGAIIRLPAAQPIATGGEHTVYYPGGGWVLKLTHPGTFGLYVEADVRLAKQTPQSKDFVRQARATPGQYLERVILTRDVFGDDLRFVGIAVDENDDIGAVVAQPFIRGDAPSYERITDWLGEFGFAEVEYGNFYRRSDRIAVFDPWPRNFVELGQELLPIDLVVVHARGAVLAYEEKYGRD